MMKINKQIKLIFAHAILWAWLMISIAYFNPATPDNFNILLFLIAGWFISQSILISAIGYSKDNNEMAVSSNPKDCIKRVFNLKKSN